LRICGPSKGAVSCPAVWSSTRSYRLPNIFPICKRWIEV
jgi:hypothetical protein